MAVNINAGSDYAATAAPSIAPNIAPAPGLVSAATVTGGDFEPDLKVAVGFVRAGGNLKKYTKRRPWRSVHVREFRVDFNSLFLVWHSPAKPPHKTKIVLADVKEILTGEESPFFKNKDDRDLGIEIVGGSRKLRLVCFQKDEWRLWFRGLTYAHTKAATLVNAESSTMEHPGSREIWEKAPLTEAGTMTFRHAIAILGHLNIKADVRYVRDVFEYCNRDGSYNLMYADFCTLLNSIIAVPELAETFAMFQTEQTGFMDQEELEYFLKDVQIANDDEIEAWKTAVIRLPKAFREGNKLTYLGFCIMMTSSINSCVKPAKLRFSQDMDHPLTHYWISGSFKAGVDTRQFARNRPPTMIIAGLLSEGVRHLHLEVTADANSEPEISQVPLTPHRASLESVLRVIKDAGFKNNAYPIFIHFCIDASAILRARTASITMRVLGKILVTRDELATSWSPNALKGRVLVMAPLIIPDQLPVLTHPANEEYSFRKQQVQLENGYSDLWSPLPALQPALHPLSPRLHETRKGESPVKGLLRRCPISGEAAQYEEMVALPTVPLSVSTSCAQERLIGIASAPQMSEVVARQASQLVDFHRTTMTAVIPNGTGIYCKDLDPTEHWASGVHICAVPHYQGAKGRLLHLSRFAENGSVGYVLKPPQLRGMERNDLPVDLCLKVVHGRQLPRRSQIDATAPYLTMAIRGDKELKVISTKVAKAGLGSCEWENVDPIVFTVQNPALSTLIVEAMLHDGITPQVVACNAFPITHLRTGLRWMSLFDTALQPVPWAGILIEITMKSPKGARQRRQSLHPLSSVSISPNKEYNVMPSSM